MAKTILVPPTATGDNNRIFIAPKHRGFCRSSKRALRETLLTLDQSHRTILSAAASPSETLENVEVATNDLVQCCCMHINSYRTSISFFLDCGCIRELLSANIGPFRRRPCTCVPISSPEFATGIFSYKRTFFFQSTRLVMDSIKLRIRGFSATIFSREVDIPMVLQTRLTL